MNSEERNKFIKDRAENIWGNSAWMWHEQSMVGRWSDWTPQERSIFVRMFQTAACMVAEEEDNLRVDRIRKTIGFLVLILLVLGLGAVGGAYLSDYVK